ncbi:zf-HC2 domain-containing protein [Desulfofundulus thermocisternus]|uniref:zf-HC2 domain-containing protein n=1 Tax=Desulfofundulus thermocisternus TaxID=42471 RepID=UPI00217D72D9|nr:zf-HC2 domain-containing protein [Desulfofundulus thermocisternus]MCS5695679.1 zf-HC2 domain-containing protein [Desulfofundulus thermocisternus]
MDCQQIREYLSAYLDGELESSRLGQIKAHLEECAACRRHWEELQASMKLLRALPEVSPPEFFREQLLQRLPGRRFTPWYARFRPAWLRFAAAAVILVAVLSLARLGSVQIIPRVMWPWQKGGDNASLVGQVDRERDDGISSDLLKSSGKETGFPPGGEERRVQAAPAGSASPAKTVAVKKLPQTAGGNYPGQEQQAGGAVKDEQRGERPVPAREPAPGLFVLNSPPALSGEKEQRAAGTSRSGANGKLRKEDGGGDAPGALPPGPMLAPGISLPGDDISSGVKAVKKIMLVLEVKDINEAGGRILELGQKYNAPVEAGEQSEFAFIISGEVWPGFFKELGAIGRVREYRVDTRDITPEYENLEEKLGLLKERERELLALNREADPAELVQVQEEIKKVTEQLDALSGSARKITVRIVLCTNSSCQQDQLQVK